uniref:EF-hand domain-containing protein n=1 Tax=Panagrellus redivivus TaxID=6233 RepID=A0A7E4VF09_PANRE
MVFGYISPGNEEKLSIGNCEMAKVIFILIVLIGAVLADIVIPDRLDWADFQKYDICNPVVAAQCFSDMDSNHDKIVTKAERDAYYSKNNARIEALNQAMYDSDFKTADSNGDGYVSPAEMDAYGKSLDIIVDSAFENYVNSLDADNDGRLSKTEFVNFEKGWPSANLRFDFDN